MYANVRGWMKVGVLGLAAGLAVGACGDVQEAQPLTLKSFHALSADKDGCTPEQEATTGGTYDVDRGVNGTVPFLVYLQLINNLTSTENEDVGSLNTNQVKLETVVVRYDNTGPWTFLPASVEIPVGYVIDADEELMGAVGILPSILTEKIDEANMLTNTPQPLHIQVQAKGELLDGTPVESNELGFNLELCVNCLFCPAGKVPTPGCTLAQPDGYTCEEP